MSHKTLAGFAFALALGISVVSCGADGSRAQSSPPRAILAQPPTPPPSADTPDLTFSQPSNPAPSWSEVFEEINSGVVRIAVTTCDGKDPTGSGFLVGPDLVATASHVVENATSLSVRAGAQVRNA